MLNSFLSLEFIFSTDTGEHEKIIVDYVKENLDKSEMLLFAEDVIKNNYFTPRNGNFLTEIEQINLITRVKDDLL